jgi:hypothetical protein
MASPVCDIWRRLPCFVGDVLRGSLPRALEKHQTGLRLCLTGVVSPLSLIVFIQVVYPLSLSAKGMSLFYVVVNERTMNTSDNKLPHFQALDKL